MTIRYVSRPTAILLAVLPWLCFADPIDDAENLPATDAEIQFIDDARARVEAAAPTIEGWHREFSGSVTSNSLRDGERPLVYERAREIPLPLSLRVSYREITDTDRREAAEQKSAEQLQQEMMAAAMRGETEKLEQLQQQLAITMQARMEAGAMGQAAGITPIAAREDPDEFSVAVIVNGDGETIGKVYDHDDIAGVTKAFRTGKDGSETIGYKYYLGDWSVTEADAVNWHVSAPHDKQTAANHLRALVVLVYVFGERDSVEEFVANHLDLADLIAMVN